MPISIADRIARELAVLPNQVNAAIGLLDGGATVPFIARYRKEATGGLDDAQLRQLEERLGYLRELDERRGVILQAIDEQGKLTPALRASIEQAETKQRLEDLYLPYKVKRRTKAEMAREAGLEPLADALLADGGLDADAAAAAYLREPFTTEAGDNPGVADAAAALEGARWIVMERCSEDAELLATLRAQVWEQGVLVSKVVPDKEQEGAKFRDYFDFAEPIAKVPPHRALALFRGRGADVLRVALKLPEDLEQEGWRSEWGSCERRIAAHLGVVGRTDAWAADTVRMTWRAKLGPGIESTLLAELRGRAEEEAIRVFARNLQDLLLAAPAGPRATMGLDPGIRTGVKVAVVDATGKLVETATIYPFQPRNDVEGSLAVLAALAARHRVELVAIGNGTASRETDALVRALAGRHPELRLHPVMVSEAGASVYSASAFASREFPELDVSLRGAVSIARRLQDPLAERVKIEPKSIGVGQYQHDVAQTRLAKALDAVVEDCVNRVGVDVNTASAPLLARISGLSPSLAENVVALRDSRGPFRSRRQLLDVPRLGPKAFEQAAGFLRIRDGDDPLDASAVHPEAYPVVERILGDLNAPIDAVLKNPRLLKPANAERYVDDRFGLPTVRDILAELEKPGRDPRPEFKTATFRDGVNELKDLSPGMVLEGVVTNVTNFGAFVDVGVHQDGLVHISLLADRFVKDPHEVVKAGDVVRVKVLEVDLARKRIGLSMRLDEAAPRAPSDAPSRGGGPRPDRARAERPQGAMAAAFAQAKDQNNDRGKR
ncbi:MAG: Tex family protein [Pseudomonadales bacterium]